MAARPSRIGAARPSSASEATALSCNLETGRTHQIRVHMAHIGHPVIGDPLYAKGFATKASKLGPEARSCGGGDSGARRYTQRGAGFFRIR